MTAVTFKPWLDKYYRLDVRFRYSAGAGAAVRTLTVNGVLIDSALTFPDTTAWTTWGNVIIPSLLLNPSQNSIVLSYETGNSGVLNLDHMVLSTPTYTDSFVTDPGWPNRFRAYADLTVV